MSKPFRRGLVSFAAALVAVATVGVSSAPALTITPVATGLDQPRGMAFGPNGALYVAEAGEGGTDFCFPHPILGEACGGMTGGLTRIWRGKQERILQLPSIASPAEALGPSDVSVQGNGNLFVTIGLGADPAILNGLPPAAQDHGWLVKGNPSGNWRRFVNIAAFEAANNPDAGQPGTQVDSNPNAVLAGPGRQVVVDAGANDVLLVDEHRDISVLAVFPVRFVPFGGGMIPMQPVPTSIAAGPDGAFYIGQLTGFPFPLGGANVYRLVPGQAPTVYASGFTNILDVAFGPDGSLYVAEIFHFGLLSGNPAGGLWRVPPGGGTPQLLTTELNLLGGVVVGQDGGVYVSTCATCRNAGAVVKITL
jgi:hypothetical protein